MNSLNTGALGAALLLCGPAFTTAHGAWEPTRPVEFIVPAGTGGGADIWPAPSRASSPSTV